MAALRHNDDIASASSTPTREFPSLAGRAVFSVARADGEGLGEPESSFFSGPSVALHSWDDRQAAADSATPHSFSLESLDADDDGRMHVRTVTIVRRATLTQKGPWPSLRAKAEHLQRASERLGDPALRQRMLRRAAVVAAAATAAGE